MPHCIARAGNQRWRNSFALITLAAAILIGCDSANPSPSPSSSSPALSSQINTVIATQLRDAAGSFEVQLISHFFTH